MSLKEWMVKMPVKETIIAGVIEKEFSVTPVTISRAGGYSNENFLINAENNKQYVARLARTNRTEESCLAEAHVLNHLTRQQPSLAPVPVITGADFALLQMPEKATRQYLHLFHKIPGAVDCLWWQQCSREKLAQLFKQLAVLHRQMNAVPPLKEEPAGMRRYDLPDQAPAVLQTTEVGRYVTEKWQAFRDGAFRIQQDMQQVFPWHKAHYQWIHGDVQLENVLFEGNILTAFLDFEWVSWDACEKDVILSAFRTCKEGTSDDFFRYDSERLALALNNYRQEDSTLCDDFFREYDILWKPFFCLDQSMLYLINAWDGVWELIPGIGFLPCFHEVVEYRSFL